MAILVSDSSVLFDLERGGFLESAFACGLPMVVPDLLFENELRDYNGTYFQKLGLSVTSLNSDEVELAQDIQAHRPTLSLEDCFALVCAGRKEHILLAGDATLRKEASARKIVCRGVLWLLDEMFATGTVSAHHLCEGLTRIKQDKRCRLPKTDLESRIKKWCNSSIPK